MRSGTIWTLTLWLAGAALAVAEPTKPTGVIAVGFDDTPQPGHTVQQTIYPPMLEESAVPTLPDAQPPAPPPAAPKPDEPAPLLVPVPPRPVPPAATPVPAVTAPPYPAVTGYGYGPVAADAVAAPSVVVDHFRPLPVPMIFGDVEYLLFAVRRGPTVPLAQTLPPELANVNPLPANAASTSYGDSGIRYGAVNGGRVSVGAWLDDARTFGVDGSFFQLEQKSDSFFIASKGVPVIGRFFIDPTNKKQPNTFLFKSMPNGSESGFIDVHAPLQELYGADANLRFQGTSIFARRFEWLVGARYLDLREGLFVHDRINFNDLGPDTFLDGTDNFRTTNQFYGAQVGGESHYRWGDWSLDVTNKFALGGVKEVAHISGATSEVINGVLVKQVVGDLLTAPTNVGIYRRAKVAFLYEMILKLGYQFNDNVGAFVGYDLITLTNVMRPGNAQDAQVNPQLNQFINTAGQAPNNSVHPVFRAQGTDFWATGLMLGVNVGW